MTEESTEYGGTTRRQWMIRIGSLAAGTAAIFGYRALRHQGQQLHALDEIIPPIGISQRQINEIYADMHRYISQQKAIADNQGKKFILLLADEHADRNAWLLEAMAMDIGHRLGINNLHVEFAKPQTDRHVGNAKEDIALRNSARKSYEYVRQQFALSNNDENNKAIGRLLFAQHMNSNDKEVKPDSFKYAERTLGNAKIALWDAVDRNMNILPGDPLYDERISAMARGGADAGVTEAYENEMIGALRDSSQSTIGVYGGAHVPVLLQGLNNDPKIYACAINCIAGKAGDDQSKLSPLLQDRIKQIESLDSVYTPNLRGLKNFPAGIAYAVAQRAALYHHGSQDIEKLDAMFGNVIVNMCNNFTQSISR